jgi:O-acetylhomoserine (thiol)-lyase
MGGAIVDSGNFDWEASGKFKELTEPDETYHGVKYTQTFGKAAFIVKARVQNLRDLGSCQSPFNSYLTLLGVETLSLRMQRHCDTTLKLAKELEKHPYIYWVNYPGLKSNKYYDMAQKYMPKGCSSILGFGVKGGAPAGEKFINELQIPIHTTNIGDSRSIITYPYLTTHRQLSKEQLKACGVSDDFMRLSVGLEDFDDIMDDINQALEKAQK